MNRIASPDLLQRFVRSMRELGAEDAVTLVAVSGGADSMCLLDLTIRAASSLNVTPHVVHLDHGWRENSADDARFVAEYVQTRGLPLHEEKAEGLVMSEESGRAARLGLFARISKNVGASAILLGHSADDQVETVLQKLLRGTGIDGLVGMQARTSVIVDDGENTLLRPLLGLRRNQLRSYCGARSIPYRDDPSNQDPRFLRNRIRAEIVPVLEGIVPGATAAIARLTEIITADRDYIDAGADVAWMAAVIEDRETFSVDQQVFRHLPLSIQRALLRRIGETLLGPSNDLSFERIEAARQSIVGRVGGIVIQWPAPVQLRIMGGRAHFHLEH